MPTRKVSSPQGDQGVAAMTDASGTPGASRAKLAKPSGKERGGGVSARFLDRRDNSRTPLAVAGVTCGVPDRVGGATPTRRAAS